MVLGAQLARNRSENAGADRLHLRIDQHRRIAVEADDRTVRALDVLRHAHDDGLHHLALLDAAARDRLLHRHDDDVADGGILALGSAEHLDAHDTTRAGIIRHVEVCLHLNHDALLVFSFRATRLNDLFLLAPDRFPALEPRDRPPFLDPDDIAHVIFVGLIMGVVLLGAPHRLLHHRMGVTAFDPHDDGLVLIVAHHDTLELALRHFETSISTSTSPSDARRASEVLWLLFRSAPRPSPARCRRASARRWS